MFADKAFKTFYMLAASSLLLLHRKTRPVGILLIIAIVLAELEEDQIKDFVQRARPFRSYKVDLLVSASGYSFPSGHTWRIFTAATVLAAYFRKYSVPIFAFAAFIGFTRLYLFVHYPTDVLAGAVFGILNAALLLYIARRYPALVQDNPAAACGGQDADNERSRKMAE